jgi:TonB family protein
MPSKFKRFCTSFILILSGLAAAMQAQSPTSGDVMRERISKAKAFIAVRNYNAAIYELENIRRETADPTVQGVVNVLLMNSYLEQSDYKRAQDFLNDFYNQQKTTKAGAAANYFAVAGQVVKGARNRVERYRALGLNVSDRTLPLEAINDLEKMRETLELVVTHSKEIGKDKTKGPDAMAILEEAANSRSMLARDDYDARRWRDEIADTREEVASSRSVVINAVNDGTGETFTQTSNPAVQPGVNQPVASQPQPTANTTSSVPNYQPAPTSTASNNKPIYTPDSSGQKPLVQQTVSQQPINAPPQPKPAENNNSAGTPNVPKQQPNVQKLQPNVQKPEPNVQKEKPIMQRQPNVAADASASPAAPVTETAASGAKSDGPMEVGSLVPYAMKQAPPVYPAAAKTIRQAGIVKVEVTIDENGQVADVQKVEGPVLLQAAAKDAVRKWRFKPFVRDGQPVRAVGFVSFNFAL